MLVSNVCCLDLLIGLHSKLLGQENEQDSYLHLLYSYFFQGLKRCTVPFLQGARSDDRYSSVGEEHRIGEGSHLTLPAGHTS